MSKSKFETCKSFCKNKVKSINLDHVFNSGSLFDTS